MRLVSLISLSGLFAKVHSACDNACSGHGTCTFKDICQCWSDWRTGDELGGGDCSDRSCPSGLAWVDAPDSTGLRHKYMECSARGICDRTTGQCGCFDGYTGKACQRTTCPNDCSGHGRCEYIEDLPYGSVWGDYYGAFEYSTPPSIPARLQLGLPTTTGIGEYPVHLPATQYWDNHKTMGCLCDPTWTDVDCSRRMCPRGNDVLGDSDCNSNLQIQTIILSTATWFNKTFTIDNITRFEQHTFALKFTSRLNESFITEPIKFPTALSVWRPTLDVEVRNALISLPNQVIDDVDVSVGFPSTGYVDTALVEGPAWNLTGTYSVGATAFQHLQRNVSISVTFTGDAVQGPQNLLSVIAYTCEDGCTPRLDGTPLDNTKLSSYVRESTPSAYTNWECGRRGKCDYTSGLCQCFDGYTGEACGLQTALI